jgi:hypothetical protein
MAGPQASSVLVPKMRYARKTSTLEACGPAIIFRPYVSLFSFFS